jgi:hypothetical protein
MIAHRGLLWGIFGAACLLLVVSLLNISAAITIMRGSRDSSENRCQSLLAREMQTIDNALKSTTLMQPFAFKGEFEGPLRMQGAGVAGNDRESHRVSAPTRPPLIFKGILMKESPLAIIEDETGKTYICKVGEEVLSQKIIKIQPTSLTLSDGKGTYSLSPPGE